MTNCWYCEKCGHFMLHHNSFGSSEYCCQGCDSKGTFLSPRSTEYMWGEEYERFMTGEAVYDMSQDEFESLYLEHKSEEPRAVLREATRK